MAEQISPDLVERVHKNESLIKLITAFNFNLNPGSLISCNGDMLSYLNKEDDKVYLLSKKELEPENLKKTFKSEAYKQFLAKYFPNLNQI